MHGGCAKLFAIVNPKRAESGAAQPCCPFEHRLEHRCEIAPRRIDDPQHLGGRGLLCQRPVSLSLGFVKLALEIGNDLLRIG
jgi:hypothetical protein